MILKACETCQYFRATGRWSHMRKDHVTVTECRHGAPDVSNGWPIVRDDDWCGCYEPSEEPSVAGLTSNGR